MAAHAELLHKAQAGRIDVYFVGDSITRRWGADRIQNILWRLEHGELDGVNPKVIVVLAGTNDVGSQPGDEEKVVEITRGLEAIRDVCRRKAPAATIILTAIFPRNDNLAMMPETARVNRNLRVMADGVRVRYLDVNERLADPQGRLLDGMMHERDKLHPTLRAYQVWADALKPLFWELLGPPAEIDDEPPPTSDPGARPPG